MATESENSGNLNETTIIALTALLNSFSNPERTLGGMPPDIGELLRRVDQGSGRQELYENQLPALLRELARQTRVESITASVAIEGVEVEQDRAERLARGTAKKFRDRDEQEFAGYRDAIDFLMRQEGLDVIEPRDLLAMHAQLFKFTEISGGRLKTEDNLIMSRDEPGGPRRTVFRPPSHHETEGRLISLCSSYAYALEHKIAHQLVLLGAFVLDLLAIHPVEDGNGRVARLATTHELLRLGYGVPRYISVEQLIYDSKNSYYDALESSQRGWHEGEHDIWPWVRYLITTLGEAYDAFEGRVVAARGAKLTKGERARQWVEEVAPARFRFRDARQALPGISEKTIRTALEALRKEGALSQEGHGAGSIYIKTDDATE